MQQKLLAGYLREMHRRNPETKEGGFGGIERLLNTDRDHADDYVSALIAAFHAEQRQGLRAWLLELIGSARAASAVPFLREHLYSEDESVRFWALHGLQQLDTKDVRTILWEERVQVAAIEAER